MLGVFDTDGRCLHLLSSSLPFTIGAADRLAPVPTGSRADGLWMIGWIVVERQEWSWTATPNAVAIGDVVSIDVPPQSWLRLMSAEGGKTALTPDDKGVASWNAPSAGQYLIELCGAAKGRHQIEVQTIERMKAAAWDAVKAKREEVRLSVIDVASLGQVQADIGSRALIDAQAVRGNLEGGSFTVSWTLADNTTRICTISDLHAMQRAIGARDDACQQRSAALRAQIEGAETPPDIKQIDIQSGWPPAA